GGGASAGGGGGAVAGLGDDDARGIAMEGGHAGFAGGLALPGAALGDVVDEAGGGAALGEPVDGGLEAPDEDAVALFGELADGEGDAAVGVEVEVGDVGELAVHRGAILEGWTIEEVGDANAGALPDALGQVADGVAHEGGDDDEGEEGENAADAALEAAHPEFVEADAGDEGDEGEGGAVVVREELALHRDAGELDRDDAEHEEDALTLARVERTHRDGGDDAGRGERGEAEEGLFDGVVEHLGGAPVLPRYGGVSGGELAERPREIAERAARPEPEQGEQRGKRTAEGDHAGDAERAPRAFATRARALREVRGAHDRAAAEGRLEQRRAPEQEARAER